MFSSLRHFLERLRAAKLRQTTEDYLQRDLDALDQQSPGWDEPLRIREALLRLEQGLSEQQVRAVYGDRTLDAALRRRQKVAALVVAG